MFRNQWEGPDDIVVTALFKPSRGNYGVPAGEIMVWGLGKKTKFPVKVTAAPTDFAATPAGGVVTMRGLSFGVDFSGASGAPALLVLAGRVTGTVNGATQVTAGDQTYTIMTLQKGSAPQPEAEGDRVRIGAQTISHDGKRLVFGR
jgi:hypothetical protein